MGRKKIDTTSPIIDTYSNNMDLDLSSVHLFYMTINANGSATKGAEVSKADYTISQELNSTPNENQLNIQLKDGIDENQAINIYYNTVVNQIISVDNPQNVKINNSVDQNGIPPVTPPAITQPKQQVVIKNTPTLDLNNKIATWTVDVNKNKYELNDATFVDKIDYSELGYVSIPGYVENGQFLSIIPQVKDTTTNTVLKGALTINGVAQPFPGLVSDPSEADYVVDIRQVPNPGNGAEMAYTDFEIKFQNQYSKTSDSFRLSYSVRYNRYSNGAPIPSTLTYGNKIDMTWLDKDGGERTSTSNHGFTTTTNEANQGLKSGEYNATTKEITWTILANYNNEGTQSFDIEDPILPNSLTGDESNSQTYVPGSLSIVRGRVNSSGVFVPATESTYSGEQKDKSYIRYSEPNASQNVLDLNLGGEDRGDIPGWDSSAPMVYQVQFKTSLKGKEVNQATFKNVATTDVLGIKNTLSASVSVKYGGQPLGKTGNFSNNKVNWSLTVNQAQSKLLNPIITDTPSNNQVIDPDTIVLYPTIVSKDGTITKDVNHPLVQDKDYHIQLSTDPENGQQSLVVTFGQQYKEEGQTQIQTIERPYILDYQTKPNLSSNSETVTNNASLKADGTEIVNPDVTTSTVVKIPSGSGLAYGKKGKITIKKVNSEGSPLAGARLELVRVYKNNNIAPEEIYNVTTPSTGEVTLGNLVYTDSGTSGFKYVLKELKAPSGYSVSPSLKVGIELTVNDQSSQSMAPLSIQNDSVTLNFYKKSESGANISGGKFILEKLNDQGGKNQIGQPFFATQSGVALKNLEVGDYQIRELEVPSDEKGPLYLSNPDILKFSVKDTGEGVIKIYGADHPDQPITSLDMVNYQGKAQLIKENEYGEALSGAEFKLSWAPLNSSDFTEVNDPDKKPFLTDKEGKLLLSHLRPGKYKVQESKAPAGYYINPKEYTFTINGEADNAPDTIDLNSDHPLIDYKGMAQFTKTDEDGTTPLSGATFVLLDSSGNYINGKGEVGQAQRVTSDLLGHFKVSGLSPSMSYQLVEVQAPIGYVINDRPLTFTTPSSTLEEANGSIEDKNNQLIFQEDTPFLNYNWKVFWDKVGQENLNGGEKAPLGGAYYKLYKKDASGIFQDIAQSDNDYGQVEKEVDNQSTKVFESNPITGRVSAVKLTGGDYYYQEIAAPEGYILDNTKYYFSLPEDFEPENGNMINVSPEADSELSSTGTQNVKIRFESSSSNNSALVNYKGAVEMKKVDKNGTPLAGAKFKVYTDANQEVEQGGKALVVESQENGTVYAEGLAPGSYYFQEIASPGEQYIINTQKVPFSIDTSANGKPKVKIIMEGSKNMNSQIIKELHNLQNLMQKLEKAWQELNLKYIIVQIKRSHPMKH
ncbi:SpaA isopeptide-forming pilin-related protein [Lactococcus lactis]|nr:SpaA isopeptide-forming pilin-related protein [Lactococcus lactis]